MWRSLRGLVGGCGCGGRGTPREGATCDGVCGYDEVAGLPMVGEFCNRGRIGVGKTSLNLKYSITHLGERDTPGRMWDGGSPGEPGGVEVGVG